MKYSQSYLMLAVCLALATVAEHAKAVVIAADDFSATGSGTGWEAGSDWDGSVAGGAATWGNVNRNFAAPVDPEAYDKIYIAFDYTQTTGAGGSWSGLAFFEGIDAMDQETFFIGDTGQVANYSIDLKDGALTNGGVLESGIDVDATTRRLIAELDINAGSDDFVRFWVDSTDINSPLASSGPFSSVIDAPWLSLRLAGDGSTEAVTDNLIIATTAAEVGLVPEPTTLVLLIGFGAGLAAVRRRTA